MMQQLTIFDIFEDMKEAPEGKTCLDCYHFAVCQSFGNKTCCHRDVISRPRIKSSHAACKHFKFTDTKIRVHESSYGLILYWVERDESSLPRVFEPEN